MQVRQQHFWRHSCVPSFLIYKTVMNIFIAAAVPVYDDWESALEVCKKIDAVLEDHASLNVSLMLIEDGSTSVVCPSKISWRPRFIARLSVLVLRRNLGHQRAIAIGLAHLKPT